MQAKFLLFLQSILNYNKIINMKAKTLFRIVLVLVIIVLAVLVMRSIMRPEKFSKEKN